MSRTTHRIPAPMTAAPFHHEAERRATPQLAPEYLRLAEEEGGAVALAARSGHALLEAQRYLGLAHEEARSAMAPQHLFAAEQAAAALTGISRRLEAELTPLMAAAPELAARESQIQVEHLGQGARQGDRITAAIEELAAALFALTRAGAAEPAWSPPVAGREHMASATSGAEQIAGSSRALAAALDQLLYQGLPEER